ncbi:MAG: putative toxin-antitoxin system toxin component, PIN family [Solirubrobacterales bacterium]
MRRAVLDPGVLVSALISPSGTPARLVAQAVAGEFELIVSPALLAELDGVLRREKFRPHFDLETAGEYVALLGRTATNAADPEQQPSLRSTDPDDDYLIALAHSQNAVLVSGDSDLLDLLGGAPICAPADFLATVA